MFYCLAVICPAPLNEIINEKPLKVKRSLEIIRLKPKFAVFGIIKIEIGSALGCW